MLHDKWWIGLLAWIGIAILPTLFASLWIPELAERVRFRFRPHHARGGWHPVRRVSFIAELVVRASFWAVAKVLRLDREAGR